MVKELDPSQTKRAAAFEAWQNAPLPMVTMLKTLNVTNLVRISRHKRYKFTMLMCWCIGKAASQCEDFYLLPVADKLMQVRRACPQRCCLHKRRRYQHL